MHALLPGPRSFSFSQLEAACCGLPSSHTTPVGSGSKIGEGATGEVFRGLLPSPSPGAPSLPIALKRLKVAGAPPELRDAFLRAFSKEVAILSRYSHQNLVLLHGSAVDVERQQYV